MLDAGNSFGLITPGKIAWRGRKDDVKQRSQSTYLVHASLVSSTVCVWWTTSMPEKQNTGDLLQRRAPLRNLKDRAASR